MRASRAVVLVLILGTLVPCLVRSESVQPPGVEIPENRRLGDLPDYFMLNLSDPGCDPDEDCDDVGPRIAYRNWYKDQTLCNVGHMGVSWGDVEKTDPGDGEPVYDFSGVTMSERDQKMKFKVCGIGCGGANWISDPKQGIGPPWVERDEFKFTTDESGKKVVSEEYWSRYEHFVEAACRFAREKYGVTIFATGGNERDLVDRKTYEAFYPDWHFYYMAPVTRIHRAMKRAHPDNRLIIGNMCYTDRAHMGALYQAGAKGHFEILAIHAYGREGVYLDMYQIIESHNAMAEAGDEDIGIILTEGWSCFPLPERIDKDPILRRGARVYTPEDCEHYRQTVLDGWRNLMTPRPGEYKPEWVIGAHYFVLNDHWGGRGWERRAVAVFEEDGQVKELPAVEYHGQGQIKSFKLDGYNIGTGDPLWIKPFLRPWGLIAIDGMPKGDTVFNFPPYLLKHEISVDVSEPLPELHAVAGHEYELTVRFTNQEASPMSDFRLEMIGRDEFERKIQFRALGGDPDTTIAPGQTVTHRFTAVYPAELAGLERDGGPRRIRGYADAHYTWEGRPYHTDGWVPNVVVTLPVSLALGEGPRTAPDAGSPVLVNVTIKSTHAAELAVQLAVDAPPELAVEPPTRARVPATGQAEVPVSVRLRDPNRTGIYEIAVRAPEVSEPLKVSVAFPGPAGAKPVEGFSLRNPSFEAEGVPSGYAFWDGEMTNWVQNTEAKSLPDAGERAFGAATDWLEFDYTLSQTVDLPQDAAGKRVEGSAWFVARGWDGEAKPANVKGHVNIVLLDGDGNEVGRTDGPPAEGTETWRRLSATSDAIPAGARRVRLELRLASHVASGCHRGAMDLADLQLVP